MAYQVTAGSTKVHPNISTMAPKEERYIHSQIEIIAELVNKAEIHRAHAEITRKEIKSVQTEEDQAREAKEQARLGKDQASVAKDQARAEKEQALAEQEKALATKEAARVRREANEDLVVSKLGAKLQKTGSLPENEMRIYKEFTVKIAARKQK